MEIELDAGPEGPSGRRSPLGKIQPPTYRPSNPHFTASHLFHLSSRLSEPNIIIYYRDLKQNYKPINNKFTITVSTITIQW